MKFSATGALYVCAIALQTVAQENKANESGYESWATLHGRAAVQFNSRRFAEALGGFEAALPLAKTAEQRAMTVGDIGYALRRLGRNIEAIAQFERALAAWRSIDPGGLDAIRTAISLAKMQQAVDRYAEAERTLRTALETSPRDNESLAAVLNALGDLMNPQDRLAEAHDNFAAALKISSRRSENRVNALIGLADIDRCLRRWQTGIDRLNEALSLSRDMNKPMLEAGALLVLGDTYSDMGDDARAEPLLKRALAIFDGGLREGPQYVSTLTSLGALYAKEGKNALAQDAYNRALNRDAHAADSQETVALQLLAVVLAKEKRPGEAGDAANRAYGIAVRAFGENSPLVASALAAMAFVEENAGDPGKAEHDYAEALRIMRSHEILSSSAGLQIMTRYAIVLRKLHRGREAKSVNAELKTFRSAQPTH